MTTVQPEMGAEEHIRTALYFLDQAEQEIEAGDVLQGSEKMWGAVCHAIIGVCQLRDWAYRSHRAFKSAVVRFSSELDDPLAQEQFSLAEKFHVNFYHGIIPTDQLKFDLPIVRRFVERIVEMVSEERTG